MTTTAPAQIPLPLVWNWYYERRHLNKSTMQVWFGRRRSAWFERKYAHHKSDDVDGDKMIIIAVPSLLRDYKDDALPPMHEPQFINLKTMTALRPDCNVWRILEAQDCNVLRTF